MTEGSQDEGPLARLREDPFDSDAWTELYRQYWPFVFGAAYRQCRGHRDLAEEVAQDVFVKLLRTRPFDRLPNPASLRGYLYTATTNTAKTALGRLVARRESSLAESAEGPSAHDATEATVAMESVRRRLAPLDQEILRLVEAGMSLREVAGVTGLSYSNAAVRLHRLRKQLHRLLTPVDPER